MISSVDDKLNCIMYIKTLSNKLISALSADNLVENPVILTLESYFAYGQFLIEREKKKEMGC